LCSAQTGLINKAVDDNMFSIIIVPFGNHVINYRKIEYNRQSSLAPARLYFFLSRLTRDLVNRFFTMYINKSDTSKIKLENALPNENLFSKRARSRVVCW